MSDVPCHFAKSSLLCPNPATRTFTMADGGEVHACDVCRPMGSVTLRAIGATVERHPDQWIQLVDGTPFWPLDARPEEVRIEHIAHALSNLCRFTGHVRKFYSVAQHSVLVSYACAPADALAGLLHDASEAYLTDIARPVKHSPAMESYRTAERRLERVIARAFGLAEEMPESVRLADEALLATEKRDLMAKGDLPWRGALAAPLPDTIVPWLPEEARAAFLTRHHELTLRSLP